MRRNENETFEEYQERRSAANALTKAQKRGVVFWDSSSQGVYHNKDKPKKVVA